MSEKGKSRWHWNKTSLLGLQAAVVATLLTSQSAFAIAEPAAGSFGYDLYDVAVNDILQGAPGFVGGLVAVIWSATKIATNWMAAGLGVVGGTAVLQADAITETMGMLI